MGREFVSVVIPTFNRAYCVAKTVDTALAQTHRDLEVVLVDDGSTDGTEQLISERYGSDPRVRYIRQTNAGVSAARNNGFANTRGDFVALLDSDDLWFPNKLAAQLAVFRAHPEVGMVWSDMEAIDMQGRVLRPRYLKEMYSAYRHFPDDKLFATHERLATLDPEVARATGDADVRTGVVYSAMIMGSLVHTSTAVLRRERLEKVGGFNGELRRLGEDYDFHLRTCRLGPVGFVDLPTIQYTRGNPDRLTRAEHHLDAAVNFLKVIEPNISQHRSEITLSDDMLDDVLSEANFWIAETAWERGRIDLVRKHLRLGLAYRPRAWKYRVKLWLASLPEAACNAALTAIRTIKPPSARVSEANIPAG